jgi:hypothetical protein
MTDDELLRRAAQDYFREAQRETDGYSYGALCGMRSVFTLTDRTDLERFVNDLLEQLRQQR